MSVFSKASVASAATTSLFVLLWSSGAIASKLGLAQASPFAFLLLRSALALAGLLMVSPLLGLRWPRGRGAVLRALGTGCVLLGAYQIFYLLALNTHVTPGIMATVMGVQPILTVVLMERQRSRAGCSGLAWGLGAGDGGLPRPQPGRGIPGWDAVRPAGAGQHDVGLDPAKAHHRQPHGYLAVTVHSRLCLVRSVRAISAARVQWSASFIGALAWMGLVVSLLATLLLYRLIARGNRSMSQACSTWCLR